MRVEWSFSLGRELRQDKNGFWAVHETVSDEEAAVTPFFPTKEEVAAYLSTYGDFWAQQSKEGPISEADAKKFIEVGFVPSAAMGPRGFLQTYQCVRDMK